MSLAQDLINQHENFATTQAGNANVVVNALFQIVATLLQPQSINLPPFNQGIVQGLGPISIGTPPTFTGSYDPPTNIPTAPNILDAMLSAYANADGPTQAALSAAMDSWLSRYMPGYSASVSALQAGVDTGISGQVFIDAFEEAMYVRFQQRIQAESLANQRAASNTLKKRGFELPQVVATATFNRINTDTARALAQSATEVYIERSKLELQHKQFCMNLAGEIQNSVRSAIVQYAGVVAGLKEFAVRYAIAVGDMAAKGYEITADVFKVELQAALAKLSAAVDANRAQIDAYKANLEAQATSKKIEYERMRAQLEAASIPYKGELERNMKQAELAMSALHAAVIAAAEAAKASASIAQAAMTGINGMANVSATE